MSVDDMLSNMEEKPKLGKETFMVQQSDPTPVYKNEKPISTKEEAVAVLEKAVEGNSWNQIELLPSGEMVIAVYVVQGYPERLEAIYHYRLEKAVFGELNASGMLRELSEGNTFGHGWDLK